MSKRRSEFMSVKYLNNKLKSKGLQKLKYYCQMCQKQCRDENGFKCHTMSEGHQRQMAIFSEAPAKFLDSFSSQFLTGFMRILKNQFGTQRVEANKVYQEYIRDKEHVHMNGTRWLTLTSLVEWLGDRGHCEVEESEKGWYITYIDKDPETLKRKRAEKAKEKLKQDDHEIMKNMISRQIERHKKAFVENKTVFSEFSREPDAKPIKFDITIPSSISAQKEPKCLNLNVLEDSEKNSLNKPFQTIEKVAKKPKSNLELLIEDKMVKKRERIDNWLVPNLVVKIVDESVGHNYLNQKAIIEDVINKYTAVVRLIDLKDVKIKLDQLHLETVIPAVGRTLRIVNGEYRDEYAKLISVDKRNYCVSVKLLSSLHKEKIIDQIPYDDVCKIADNV